MPLELGPDVAVTRDSDGVVRALNHVQAPYGGRRGVKPADLAAAYLGDAAEVFGLDATIMLEEVPDQGPDPGDTTNRLVLAEQKSLMGATTLGFQQRLELFRRNLIFRVERLFQNRIVDDLLIDHLLQLKPVQVKYGHHLNQSRRQDLLLRDF